ncbi:MAG: putative membrane protein [Nonlabens sp.]
MFANFGLIPSASNASPVYDAIFQYVAPASIFFLLLGVNLKQLKQAGMPMLIAFGVGALGTMMGVMVALQLIDYQAVFGANYAAIAGMMTGTYTGGSANFNAIALEYGMVKEGAIFTGIIVADNIMTTIWMLVTLSLPAVMKKFRNNPEAISKSRAKVADHSDKEELSPLNLGLLIAIVLVAMFISDWFSDWSATQGFGVPSILILTTIALVLAQTSFIKRISGAKLLGMFSVYLFLVVVGAFCEVTALAEVGAHAIDILVFTGAIVLVHGVVIILSGVLFKLDWSILAIASQANIGGSSTALALAKTFKRTDLVLPAILAGALGTGLGTYLGFLVVGFV